MKRGGIVTLIWSILPWFGLGGGHAIAEQVIFVDAKNPYFIVDKLPMSYQFSLGDSLCLLDEKGFLESCEAVVLADTGRIAIYLPEVEMRRLKIRPNSILRLKSIFMQDQTFVEDPNQVYTFRPAKRQSSRQLRKFSELALLQLGEIAKILPLRFEVKAGRPVEGKATGAPVAPQNAALPLGPLTGVMRDQNASEPYDKELLQYLQRVEESMTEVPDLSKMKLAAGISREELPEADGIEAFAPVRRGKKGRSPFRYSQIQVFRLFAVSPVFTYNELAFKPIADGQNEADSLWSKQSEGKGSTGGLGGQLSILTRQNDAWFFGGRYRAYNTVTYQSRLNEVSTAQIVNTQIKINSYGFWLERGRRIVLIKGLEGLFAYGLDWDASEITFKSIRNSQANPIDTSIIGFSRTNVNQFSLRGTVDQRYYIGGFGVSIGLTLLVPVWTATESFNGEVALPEGMGLSANSQDDLKEAIAHKASSFGLDIIIGLAYRL